MGSKLVSPGKYIRLSKSCLSDSEKRAVMGVLEREYLGMGSEVQFFEEKLTGYFGRSTVCVANGTAALQLALQALDIGSGDEVLVQSMTYVASFQAISATGATPIPCDIDPETFCLDWRDAENRVTSKTKAVMPVHYGGGVGALDEIYAFAKKYGLRVVEDAAHAFGTKYHGKRIGGFGDITCFSFDGIKNITSGEGGCIVTSDAEVLSHVRDSRLLGVEKDTENRFEDERSWEFDVTTQGWRYHMSNIMAVIGIEQLKRFPELSENRKTLAKKYESLFREMDVGFIEHDYEEVVPHIFVLKLPEHIARNEVREYLNKKGIESGIHYQPNHNLLMYQRDGQRELVEVDKAYSSILTVPLHPDLSIDDVEYVASSIAEFL